MRRGLPNCHLTLDLHARSYGETIYYMQEGSMKLKVMTWNVENLFRPGAGDGPDTEAAYQDKLASLAETIGVLAPDILALQEIGSPEAFDDLMEALGAAYPHAELSKKPDGRGIRVGFLSKHALTEPAGARCG